MTAVKCARGTCKYATSERLSKAAARTRKYIHTNRHLHMFVCVFDFYVRLSWRPLHTSAVAVLLCLPSSASSSCRPPTSCCERCACAKRFGSHCDCDTSVALLPLIIAVAVVVGVLHFMLFFCDKVLEVAFD